MDGATDTGMIECEGLPVGDCDFPIVACSAHLNPSACRTQTMVTDAERLCAQFLRDRTVGVLGIFFFAPVDMSCEGEYGDDIFALGDGTAVFNRRGPGGSPTLVGLRRVEIRPPEHFEPCVDTEDVEVMRACLADWFVPDSCVPGLCCPGPNEAGHPVCE